LIGRRLPADISDCADFFAFLFEYKDLPIVLSAVLPPARSAPCNYPVAITQRRKDAAAQRMGGTELPEQRT
jgi:hypothetical protein